MYINIRIVLGCEVTTLSINKIGVNNYGVSFKGANLNSAPRKVKGAVEKLVEKAANPMVNAVAAPKSKLELLLLNNMDIGASIKSYADIMGEAGEVNKAVKDGNHVKLKKIMHKSYAKNTGEAAPLTKTNEDAPKSIKEAIRHLQIERDSYKKVASGIEEKLQELEAQKAKLIKQSSLAKKVTHKREKIEQFMSPDTFNQKEIAQAERDVALSSEKQVEWEKAQKELRELKDINKLFHKDKTANTTSFIQNKRKIEKLKLKIKTLEDSKTLTPKALRKKEILLAQRQALIDFNSKTVEELEKDKKPWTQTMLKALIPDGGVGEKDKITGNDLLKLKLESLKAEEAKTPSMHRQMGAINLNILEYGKEHKAYTANIEQLERRIEVLGFEKDKAARGIVDTVEVPVVLPHKQKKPSNISKIFSHKTLEEKRAASLERKEKIKERKAQYRQEMKQKTNVINDEIKELKEDLRSYEYEILKIEEELLKPSDNKVLQYEYKKKFPPLGQRPLTKAAARKYDEKLNHRISTAVELRKAEMASRSPFAIADATRHDKVSKVKQLINEDIKTVGKGDRVLASKKTSTMPNSDDFKSEKAFVKAMAKFVRNQRTDAKRQEKAKAASQSMSNIRMQRREISESKVKYPTIQIINDKIAQVKRFLVQDGSDQRLSDLNNKTVAQLNRPKSSWLKEIVKELWPQKTKLRKRKTTGKELLELKLKELESKKQEVISFNSKIWELSSRISKMISDRDLLKTKASIAQKHIIDLENQKLSLEKTAKSKQKQIGRERV